MNRVDGGSRAARNARNARSAGTARPARAVAQDRCALARRRPTRRPSSTSPRAAAARRSRARRATRSTDGAALLARVIDVCFAVERADDGTFRFGPEEPPWACDETVDLEGAIDELGRLVEEWREIQAVIPSLDCRIRSPTSSASRSSTVDRERWQLIVSLDGRRSVRDLVRKTNRPVLDVCHAILALVDAGAVNVGPPPAAPVAARPNRAPAARRCDAAVEPEAPYGPGVESPHPGPNGHGSTSERERRSRRKGPLPQRLLRPARRLTRLRGVLPTRTSARRRRNGWSRPWTRFGASVTRVARERDPIQPTTESADTACSRGGRGGGTVVGRNATRVAADRRRPADRGPARRGARRADAVPASRSAGCSSSRARSPRPSSCARSPARSASSSSTSTTAPSTARSRRSSPSRSPAATRRSRSAGRTASSSSRWPTRRTSSRSTTSAPSPAPRSAPSSRPPSQIIETIERFFRVDGEVDEVMQAATDEADEDDRSRRASREVVEDAPIVKFVNLLVNQAVGDRASDIHVEPTESDLRIRFRIDGVLHEVMRSPRSIQAGVISPPQGHGRHQHRRAPHPAGRPHHDEGQRPQHRPARRDPADRVRREGRHAHPRQGPGDAQARGPRLPARGARRGSRRRYTQAVRHDPRDRPDRFGQVDDAVRDAQPAERRPTATSSPSRTRSSTGCPASTRCRSTRRPGSRSRARCARSCAPTPTSSSSVRSATRRPRSSRIEAALTGHLVLSTLHTNDAASTPMRLVEMGVEPFLVDERARLRRRAAPRPQALRQVQGAVPADRGRARRRRAGRPRSSTAASGRRCTGRSGARSCGRTGYRGRFGIHEVMVDVGGDRAADHRAPFVRRHPEGRVDAGHVVDALRRPAQGRPWARPRSKRSSGSSRDAPYVGARAIVSVLLQRGACDADTQVSPTSR